MGRLESARNRRTVFISTALMAAFTVFVPLMMSSQVTGVRMLMAVGGFTAVSWSVYTFMDRQCTRFLTDTTVAYACVKLRDYAKNEYWGDVSGIMDDDLEDVEDMFVWETRIDRESARAGIAEAFDHLLSMPTIWSHGPSRGCINIDE